MQQAVQSQKTAYSRAEFAALHFTPDGEHVGYVGVYGKAAKTGQLYRILYCEADKLPEQLEELKLWNQDYYLTANTFTGGVRVSESLFTLQNIVLDVDCHDESLTPGKRQHLLDAFLYFLRADLFGAPDFLRPNTIVETGRGVQLWWAIQPVSKWKAQQYEAVREKLIERIQQLLADYPALHGLELDRGASHNAAGVFRLPGSYNSKTGKRGRFELIHEERLDILEEAKGCAVKAIRRPESKIQYIPEGGVDSVAVAMFRQAKLGQLLTLRQSCGQRIGEELRDHFLFCLYNSWGRVCPDHDQIMAKLDAFNLRFADPLPDRELRAYMSSSNRRRYKLTNQKIIDLLAITPEEQQAIGFYPGGAGKNNLREQARQEARDRKALRDAKIEELYHEGASQKQIAEAVGCDAATVGRVLQRAGKATRSQQRHAQICELLQLGHTPAEVAELVGCSLSTVYAHAQKDTQALQNGAQSLETEKAGKVSTAAEKRPEGQNEASQAMEQNEAAEAPAKDATAGALFGMPSRSKLQLRGGGQILQFPAQPEGSDRPFRKIAKSPLYKGGIYQLSILAINRQAGEAPPEDTS